MICSKMFLCLNVEFSLVSLHFYTIESPTWILRSCSWKPPCATRPCCGQRVASSPSQPSRGRTSCHLTCQCGTRACFLGAASFRTASNATLSKMGNCYVDDTQFDVTYFTFDDNNKHNTCSGWLSPRSDWKDHIAQQIRSILIHISKMMSCMDGAMSSCWCIHHIWFVNLTSRLERHRNNIVRINIRMMFLFLFVCRSWR